MISVFLAIFLSTQVHAQQFPDRFSLKVSIGDKITRFEVSSEKGLSKITVNGHERAVTPKNYKYVSQLALEISKLKSNELRLCRRSNIQLKIASKKSVKRSLGCVGSKTPVAQKLTDLTNKLMLM